MEHRITLFFLILAQLFCLIHVHLGQFDKRHVRSKHLLMEGFGFGDGRVSYLLFIFKGVNFNLFSSNDALICEIFSLFLTGLNFRSTLSSTLYRLKSTFFRITHQLCLTSNQYSGSLLLHLFIFSSQICAQFSYFLFVLHCSLSCPGLAFGSFQLI